jgi:hypothetical protein
MPDDQLKTLAKLIQRRKQEIPYTVLLGSGLSMTLGVLKELGYEDWDAFYEVMQHRSPDEWYGLLKEPFDSLYLQEGYRCLAQLLKAGYFNIVLTANFDPFLERAIGTVGLSSEEISILTKGENTTRYIVDMLKRPQPRIKVCLLRGRLHTRTTPNISETLQFDEQLAIVLKDYLARDMIVLGASNRDTDIIRYIPPQGGSLWLVSSEPTIPDQWKFLQQSHSGGIVRGEGSDFNRFFCAIADLLGQKQAGYVKTPQKLASEMFDPLHNEQRENVDNLPLSASAEVIEDEINHVQQIIQAHQKNLNIIEQLIAQHGVANVDLYFRRASLEDDIAQQRNRLRDLEARQKAFSIDRPIRVAITILYTHLPTGVIDLYDSKTMPLLKYEIFNEIAHPIKVVLEAEIEDFSSQCRDTVDIAPESPHTVYQLPHIKAEKAKELTDIRSAVVHTKVEYLQDGVMCLDRKQDFKVYLMARNIIRWATPDTVKESGYIPLLKHIAAWVTPRTGPVKQMLRKAAKYTSLEGYPEVYDPEFVRRQVRAIYLALQEAGLTYVDSPFALGPANGEERQAVRLPNESLRDLSANCIDGAVLYASLMELAGLESVIVMKKNHAFVGWKTWRGAEVYEFLETMMTREASFEDAFSHGMDEYIRLVDEGQFKREIFDPDGFAYLLDIKALHDEGIYPMMGE